MNKFVKQISKIPVPILQNNKLVTIRYTRIVINKNYKIIKSYIKKLNYVLLT